MSLRSHFPFKGIGITMLAAAAWAVAPGISQAQTALCPSGFSLVNGACTNAQGVGAFSGAALATQALSTVTQTTTQETARSTLNAIANRREEEEKPCEPGFYRVGGVCQRIPAPQPPEARPATPPTLAPAPTTGRLKRYEARPAPAPAIAERPPQPSKRREAHVEPEVVRPTERAVRRVREATPQRPRAALHVPPAAAYEPPAAPPPLFIEAPARLGTWGQFIGDYERRNANGLSSIACCIGTGAALPVPLGLNVTSNAGTIGFQTGADVTTRGLFGPGDGLIAGVLMGYNSTEINMRSIAVTSDPSNVPFNSEALMHAKLYGPSVGLYGTYFNNGFSADMLFRMDFLSLAENSNEILGFANFSPAVPGRPQPFFQQVSASLTQSSLAANLNYRFQFLPNAWIEPTVGAQYINSAYSGAESIGLQTGYLVMVQGGARVGLVTPVFGGKLLTTTLTGLAYDDVVVRGGFIPTSGPAVSNLLASADEGHIRGRGILAFNLDLGNGVQPYVQGEVRGGQGLIGAGGRVGVRVNW